jgi:hypothetical protein
MPKRVGRGTGMEETQKIQDQLINVRLDLRELSTKVDGLKDISKKLNEVDDLAKKAMDSTKAAHHRLDKIDKLILACYNGYRGYYTCWSCFCCERWIGQVMQEGQFFTWEALRNGRSFFAYVFYS